MVGFLSYVLTSDVLCKYRFASQKMLISASTLKSWIRNTSLRPIQNFSHYSICLTKGRLLLLYIFFFNLLAFLLLPQKFKDQPVEFFG